MKRRFTAIFIALFFCLSFLVPVYADVSLVPDLVPEFVMPAGYNPVPIDSLNNLSAVKNDANNFMEAFYDYPSYFKEHIELVHQKRSIPICFKYKYLKLVR